MNVFRIIPFTNSNRIEFLWLCFHAALWAFNPEHLMFRIPEMLNNNNRLNITAYSQFFHYLSPVSGAMLLRYRVSLIELIFYVLHSITPFSLIVSFY